MSGALKIEKAKSGDTYEHILKLIEKMEPRMRRVFLLGINRIRNSLDLKVLERLIEAGNIETAFNLISATVNKLADDLILFTVVAGRDTAALLEDVLDVTVSFDQVNLRAVESMRNNKLRLVQQFTNEQRKATQAALIAGIQEGLNPKAQALAFRDSIGLTLRQERAVQNFRRLLTNNDREALSRALRDKRFDGSIKRAIANGEGLNPKQIDRMVTRYRERYLRYRSQVIARTEALRSAHEGTEEMMNQAIESEALDPNKLSRKWVTAKDERVRGSHSAMNGQIKPHGQPFISGNGYQLRYPGDPQAPGSETIQCRCIVTTRFK